MKQKIENVNTAYNMFFELFRKQKDKVSREDTDKIVSGYAEQLNNHKNDIDYLKQEYLAVKSFTTKARVSSNDFITDLLIKMIDFFISLFSVFLAFSLRVGQTSELFTIADAADYITAGAIPVIVFMFILLLLKYLEDVNCKRLNAARSTFNLIYIPAFSAAILHLLQNEKNEANTDDIENMILRVIYEKAV